LILPFIVFGSMTRAFVDHGYFQMTTFKKFLLITPGIWLLSVAMGFIALTIGVYLQKRHKIEAWRISVLIGCAIVLANIALVSSHIAFDAITTATLILLIFLSLCAAIYLISRRIKFAAFANKVCFAAIAGQLWDATNTSTILQFHNAHEKHPLPRLLIEKFSPWSFLVVKLILVLAAVYLIYHYIEDKVLRNTFLIGIAIIGLGEGFRNFISLILV